MILKTGKQILGIASHQEAIYLYVSHLGAHARREVI